MSSPWAKIEKPEAINFQDILSEQVAADLAKKETQKFYKNIDDIPEEIVNNLKCHIPENDFKTCSNNNDSVGEVCSNSGLDESDAEIARVLQAQFDKEYDEELKRNEDKFNGTSKVSVSFKNYMRSPSSYDDDDSDQEEIEDINEKKDWDRFDAMEREISSISSGYKVKKDGSIVTKHDTIICARKNACKLLSFPPSFQTGDGESFDLKLSNKVYNSLKTYSRNEQSRRHRIRDKKEDQATAVFGLDEHTTLLLYKMINNQLLESFNGVISIGKEAVVLHADGCQTCQEVSVPKECVIKVFKTTLSEFKHRDKYIKGDHRFKDRIGKQTSRKTVHIWAEKEMANLCRLKKAQIPCPEVVMLKEHVLVMSFIGENRVAARKLKDADMDAADYIIAYEQVIEMMKTLFHEAKLIHADLSEYNILWYNGQCYFIDVSQSVEPIHENAFHFLFRDCKNITHFFEHKSVPNVVSPNELFKSITGYDFEDKEQLLQLQVMEKPKPHTIDRMHKEAVDNFEMLWDSLNTYTEIIEKESTVIEPPKA